MRRKSKTISYYEITEADAAQAAALERENFSQPWSESGIINYLYAGNTVFVAAKHEGKVIGYGAVMCVLDEGNLVSIIVSKEYRRMKIAREILDILYDLSRERGVTKIFLEVRASNEAAINLYESEGFVKTGLRKGFYDKPKEDAYLYMKEL